MEFSIGLDLLIYRIANIKTQTIVNCEYYRIPKSSDFPTKNLRCTHINTSRNLYLCM